ncbi:MAG TPA: hypothetical protein PLA83_10930, partial [Deltaproteobacteria bacterium]|nr:hypothetical protein [Deltaproteobacteria bacterium]
NGTGKFTYPDGKSYAGRFKDGYADGKGIVTYKDGRTEEVEYVRGEPVKKPEMEGKKDQPL